MRKIIIYIVILLFFFGAFYALSMIPSDPSSPQIEGEPPVIEHALERIRVYEIQAEPFDESIVVPGMVEAYNDVELAAQISGVVEKVSVKEGDFVKANQSLFQIDLRTRQAMLKEAEASYEFAKNNLERLTPLRKTGDITIQKFDEAQTDVLRTEAAVNRLKVEVSLGYVKAPISGIIDRVDAELGEYMGEGMPLARLLHLDRVKISVGVPERYVDAAAGESSALVMIEALNEEREAEIDRVAFGADARTNTYEALLILDNQDRRIRPGMIVRTRIIVKRNPEAVLIPMFALIKKQNGMNVFVEKEAVVELRPVQVGAISGARVEILDGLSPGEHIVVIGQKDVVDGQKVNVMEIVTSEILRNAEALQP